VAAEDLLEAAEPVLERADVDAEGVGGGLLGAAGVEVSGQRRQESLAPAATVVGQQRSEPLVDQAADGRRVAAVGQQREQAEVLVAEDGPVEGGGEVRCPAGLLMGPGRTGGAGPR